MLLPALTLHILADIGNYKFYVGYLSDYSIGNYVELFLNSQSSRYTPTVVSYQQGYFFVGEYALQQSKREDSIMFKNFFLNAQYTTLYDVLQQQTFAYDNVSQHNSILLFSAIMNYISYNYLRNIGFNETIYVSLLHSSDMKLQQIAYYQQIIESYPNCYLYTTVPLSNAVVASHLMNRKREIFGSELSHLYVVIDVGSYQTELTLVKVTPSQYVLNVQNSVVLSEIANVGGDHVSECMYYQLKAYFFGKGKHISEHYRLQLWDAVERAKSILSTVDKTVLTLEDAHSPGHDFYLNVSRQLVEYCVDMLWNTTLFARFTKLRDYIKINKELPAHYIFYGGSTRIPELQRLFEGYFGADILKTVNLDEGAIVGAGMIVQRTLDGHKSSNRFSSFDHTRPYLKYDYKQLFRLNPNTNFSYYLSEKQLDKMQISLHENELEFTFINQTNIWEDDVETGQRKKRVEYSVVKENISWYNLGFSVDQPIEVFFATDDGKMNITCQVSPVSKSIEDILEPLELKNITNGEQSGFNIRKRTIIKKEISKLSEYSRKLYDAFSHYQANFMTKMQTNAMLQFNFTTDAASIPHLDWVGMFISKRSVYYDFKQQVDLGKNPKQQAYFDYFPLDFECVPYFQKGFYLENEQVQEYRRVIVQSNQLAHLSRQYMKLVNFIENISIVGDYQALSAKFATDYGYMLALLKRSAYGRCSDHVCQTAYIQEGISILFDLIESYDETQDDQTLLQAVYQFIEDNNIYLKPAEMPQHDTQPKQLYEFTAGNYRSFEWR